MSSRHGAKLILAVQEETQEYLEEAKLKELVARYSEFINFPIYLYASKEVDVPADEAADESEPSEEDEAADDDDEGVADDGKPASFLNLKTLHVCKVFLTRER